MGEECVWKLSFINRIVCWNCNVCRTAIFSDGACVGQFLLQLVIHYLAPVVQTFNSAILRINHYPGDKYYGNQLRYPADSDLSCGYRYPTFEQPGPDVFFSVSMKQRPLRKKNLWKKNESAFLNCDLLTRKSRHQLQRSLRPCMRHWHHNKAL